jgi:hypothetical protein
MGVATDDGFDEIRGQVDSDSGGEAESSSATETRRSPSNTLALDRGLPNAQLAALSGTRHGGIDTRKVIKFLTKREGSRDGANLASRGAPSRCRRMPECIRATGFAEYGRSRPAATT